MSKTIFRVKSTGELGVDEGSYFDSNNQLGGKTLRCINILDPHRDYMPTNNIRHIDPSDLEAVDRSSL